MRSAIKYVRTAIIVCVIASSLQYLVNNKSYTFAAREVKKIAEKYSGQHPSTSLPHLLSDFRRLYSKHLIPPLDPNWFTFGGSFQAKIFLIHVSFTEYLAVIGSPGRTSGHTGFHWMNQSCSVLAGNVQRWKDGSQLSRETYRPGEHIRFGMFEGSVVDLTEDTWALCYGRGVVPISVPYLAVNYLTHSADPVNPAQLFYTSARSCAKEVFYWFQDCYFHYLHKFTGKK